MQYAPLQTKETVACGTVQYCRYCTVCRTVPYGNFAAVEGHPEAFTATGPSRPPEYAALRFKPPHRQVLSGSCSQRSLT